MKFQLGNGYIKDKIKQIIKLWSHKEDKNKLLLLLLILWFYWHFGRWSFHSNNNEISNHTITLIISHNCNQMWSKLLLHKHLKTGFGFI